MWNITESQEWFSSRLPETEVLPDDIRNDRKKMEWLSGRYLVSCLLSREELPYSGLNKDSYGKPWIIGHTEIQVSLANSYPLVAAVISPAKPVGIDIERPRSSMLQVVPRILSASEIPEIQHSVERACLYWCGKEALFKKYGKRPVSMRNDLRITELPKDIPGRMSGLILREKTDLFCCRILDHILVVTQTDD